MRENLFIRLTSASLEAQTDYCIANSDAQHAFAVQRAPLAEVLARAAGRRVVVLVPSPDVRLSSVTVPARGAAKVLQAAPFALEDQLADDVETLHFAIGPRQADGSHPVAVVSRARMDEWLAPFNHAGIRVEVLAPETLCLPPVEGERWTALAEPHHISVRTGAFSGFGCAAEDLPLLLQLADTEKKHTLHIAIPRDHSPDFTALEWPVELLPGFGTALEALLHHYRNDSINLLQGAYSQSEGLARLWQPWKATAAFAACWLLVAGLSHGVQAHKLGQQLSAQQDSNAQRFTQLFPAETRIVNLEAQLDQQAAALKGGGAQGGFLPLAEVLARALNAAPGLNLKGIQYRENALFVSLGGSDLQQLELLRGWFEQNGGARLEVQSANSGSEGVDIRIKVSGA